MAPSASVAAASVFALLATGSAERSLLAHKPNGGSSLHGVALVSGPASSYLTTNGNGTWASHNNPALQTINYATVSCPSATLCVGGGPSSYGFPTLNPSIGVTAYNMPQLFTSTDGATSWQMVTGFSPVQYSTLQSLISPTMSPFPPALAYSPVPVATIAVPNPAVVPSPATNLANGIPTTQITPGTTVLTAGTIAAPNPGVAIWPDIFNVYCASRTLCFAAGGYSGNPLSSTTLTAINNQVGGYDTYGQILRSVNGGTYWSWTALPLATIVNPTASVGPLGPVGGLNAISADASGRHVFAVGSPSLALNSAAATTAAPFAGATASAAIGPTAATAASVAGGVILYSGNSGVSFIVQTAPVMQGYFYALNTVAVLRGTIAFAAGGHPFGTQGQPSVTNAAAVNYVNANGIIIATVNGGFSWIVQNIQSLNTYFCAGTVANPATTIPAAAGSFCVNSATPNNAAFTPSATQALGNIPQLNNLGFFVAPGTGTYTGWAVGNSGLLLTTQFNMTGVSNSLTSLQSVSTWAPPAAATLTGAFNNAVMLPPAQGGSANIYGIVWDNYKVGYMYGVSFILSTHNSGLSWVAETPNSIISGTSPVTVFSMAMVPTSY